MIPTGDRYRMAHDEALAAAISAIDTADPADAAAQVVDAVRTAQAAAEEALVTVVTVESRARAREVEQEERRAKADAARREEIEKTGRTVLTKTFGNKMGKAVSIFANYTIVDVQGLTLAIPTSELDGFHTRLLSELSARGDQRKTAPGYQLAKIVEPGDLDHVAADAAEAVELCRDSVTRALEAERADRQRQAEEAQLVRELAAQESLYGTTV